MKKSFQRVIATLNLFQGKQSLTIFMLAAFFALTACGDDVSANDDENGGTSPTTMTDERDGQAYRIVTIGSQTWMAENLNFDYKVAGESYGSYCYDNSADSCAKYGRLYTWAAAMDSATTGCGYGKTCAADSGRAQGVCPTGWHLPSRAEWVALFMAIGGQSTAGTALKASSGWHDNGSGTDAYGFSVFPSGYRNGGGDYSHVGNGAYFWSASEDDASIAYHMFLGYSYAHAFLDSGYNKYNAFAVRCVKDSD
jgi:uncharacterized protein (TIGR02145 family)